MKHPIKYAFLSVTILTVLLHEVSFAQGLTLKSLQFDHQIELNKIFKPLKHKNPLPEKASQQIQEIEQPDVELVGTVIIGRQKLVWLKVADQIHQLKQGQTIPGIEAQISQIQPESVLITRFKNCTDPDQCRFIINIRELLF